MNLFWGIIAGLNLAIFIQGLPEYNWVALGAALGLVITEAWR